LPRKRDGATKLSGMLCRLAKMDADTLASLRDLDPETRLRSYRNCRQTTDRGSKRRYERLAFIRFAKLFDNGLRVHAKHRRQSLTKLRPRKKQRKRAPPSGTDVDQAIDLLNGASSVLSAFGGGGGMPSRVSSTPMSVVRQGPAAAYHPTPHQRGSDITGIGSH
jgi:hypothetical protein